MSDPRPVRLVKFAELEKNVIPSDGSPWIADWRSFDIPGTIAAAIQNAAPGLVAMTLSMLGGKQMIEAAEMAAKKRGIRILWWFGPAHAELSEDGKNYLRQCVKDARAKAEVT